MATASLGSATDGRSVLLSGSDSTFTNELQDDLSGDLIAYCLASATTASPIVGTVSEITMGRVAFPIESFLVLLRTQGRRVADAFSLVQESLGSKYFGLGSWEILVFFSQIWSQFLNPVTLGLSILGGHCPCS